MGKQRIKTGGKRAGKTGNRKYYNGFTNGPGGLKCFCCGAIYNAKRVIRRKNKAKCKQIVREVSNDM